MVLRRCRLLNETSELPVQSGLSLHIVSVHVLECDDEISGCFWWPGTLIILVTAFQAIRFVTVEVVMVPVERRCTALSDKTPDSEAGAIGVLSTRTLSLLQNPDDPGELQNAASAPR